MLMLQLAEDASGHRHRVAAGILPAVEGGILPLGPAFEASSMVTRRTSIPPGGTPGSTAGKDARRYVAGGLAACTGAAQRVQELHGSFIFDARPGRLQGRRFAGKPSGSGSCPIAHGSGTNAAIGVCSTDK